MVFLVSFLVSGFCSLLDLVSMLVFKSIAIVMVLVIHVLRIPGALIDALLEQAKEAVVSASVFVVESTTDLGKSAVSSAVQILHGSMEGPAGTVSSGVAWLVELTKNATESAPAKAGELIRDLSQLLGSINTLWNNLREAFAFVQGWA